MFTFQRLYLRRNMKSVVHHSFCSLSYDRSVASSKASFPQGFLSFLLYWNHAVSALGYILVDEPVSTANREIIDCQDTFHNFTLHVVKASLKTLKLTQFLSIQVKCVLKMLPCLACYSLYFSSTVDVFVAGLLLREKQFSQNEPESDLF
jgi:hypothetical protein